MAVITKKLFPATSNATTTVFNNVGIQLNNQDDLDVYVTLSGGTRVLQLRQSTGSTATSTHPQVNNTDGLYFPAVTAGTTLYNYTLSSDNNTITFNSALPQGAVVFCERRTRDADGTYTSFASGSTVRATDLNNSATESNFTAQDGRNKALEIEGAIWNGDQISSVYVSSANIVDGTIQTADIGADQITNALIADNQIDSEHYVDGSIDHVHLANDIIDGDNIQDDVINSEHIAAGAVDLEHMSANSVDSDQYVDGSIDRVHISADAIDGTKIADDSINSEHYVDRSIDTQHIAANQVTTNELGPDAVTAAKIADDQINSEHYVAGSIDHEHLANDIIDGDNIQDDVINSEHYVAGSIDHEHLANDIIDGDNIQDSVINSEHYVDGSIDREHLAGGIVDGTKLADNAVQTAKIQDNAVHTAKINNDAVTIDKIDDAVIVTASEQAAASANDTSFFTTSASDARYFNISTGDTIKDGDTFPDNDTTIATTAAINDRIIDLVDDVGGFVPIANETSFPTANPDINLSGNDKGGTIVSVKAASTNLTAQSGTTLTIANGRGSGLAVIITGLSETIPSGFGFLVETTATDHTYAFHRLVPKATEVTTVAGKATEIGRLGTAAAVEDMSILGTTDVVADLNTLGTADVVADMNMLATSDVISDMNTLAVTDVINDMDTVATNVTNVNNVGGSIANVNTTAGSIANVNTVAGSIANVNTTAGSIANVNSVAGSIANVNTAASNISNVNNFAEKYQIASSAPSTDGGGNALAEGDLYFDTTADELKVYNGGSWQGGVTASGNFASTTGNTFTGSNIHNDNVKSIYGTSSDGLEILHNGSDSVINDTGTGSLKLQTGGNTKIEITSTGTSVTGNIVVSGNVDGRDVATDGAKLDGIDSGAKDDQTAAEIKTLLNSDQLTSAQIANGTIVNDDINSSAAIAGSKISPTFTSNVTISNNDPSILFTDGDANPDFKIRGNGGTLKFIDTTNNNADRMAINSDGHVDVYGNLDVGAGIDVTGNITVSGTVDGVDLQTLNTAVSANTAKVTNATHTGDVTGATSLTIADDAVTQDKIADDAVGADQLANTSVTAGSYGSATAIPAITVDAQGRITSASTNTVNTTTNLGTSTSTGSVTVTSSTGNNATISEATSSAAGVMSTAHHDKLDGIAAGATNVTNNNQISNGAGYITATLSNEQVQDIVGAMVSGNTETGISVSYADGDGTLDFVVASQTDNNFTTTLKNKLDGISASANNYSHPNHSGEVTSSGDGAMTIADNVVDEANLKVSNSPQNGYMLTAQSGNSGGLTWAPAAAGATGASGSGDEIFWENGTNVTADYTITDGKNAGSFGPITINSGVTVTVGANETWTVV